MQKSSWFYDEYYHGITGDQRKGDSVITFRGKKKDGTVETLAVGTQVSGGWGTAKYHIKCAFTGLYYNRLPYARLYHKPEPIHETAAAVAVFIRNGYRPY